MCGIAGIVRPAPGGPLLEPLARMAAELRHRGPDGYGFLVDPAHGLAHVRLSIIDLVRGDQPLTNEDGTLAVTFNGEIYNYRELRTELAALGHAFRTDSDTEVLVHGWESWGPALLDRLNGQFAFGLLDRRDGSLVLARDRFGVRPLFYAERGGSLVFASEVKALFASGEVAAAPDPDGLDEAFTLWAARAPRTVFQGVRQLEPGGWARWHQGTIAHHRWFRPVWTGAEPRPAAQALEELDALLRSAVALRMRADVPVGGYLSGGLDSSIACTLAAAASPHALRTFSVTFADPAFDESPHQHAVAAAIGSQHAVQRIDTDEIARVFPAVVRHAETPLLRTAPAPMYLLAQLTRARGITVVVTGEGADELFLGYDLFRETVVRRFCLRQPGSRRRPLLFDRLYPWMPRGPAGAELWRRFFLDAGPADDPLFSHQPRYALAARLRDFHGPLLRQRAGDAEERLRRSLPDDFGRWSDLDRAAWLETTTLLDGYLLAAQGDRMAMAHGVEGRYPFLDHRLFAFAAALPERLKLQGLREKALLRRWAASRVPAAVAARPKQPYRAPDAPAFFGPRAPAWVMDALAPDAVRAAGLFEPAGVAGLTRRCREGRVKGAWENQALVAVLSAQIWHQTFIGPRPQPAPLPAERASVLLGSALAPLPASAMAE